MRVTLLIVFVIDVLIVAFTGGSRDPLVQLIGFGAWFLMIGMLALALAAARWTFIGFFLGRGRDAGRK